MPRRNHIPQYREHKQSRQATVALPDGQGGRKDYLLGSYQSPESHGEYERLISEWLANGRRVPQLASSPAADLTINELLRDYMRWADQHYRDQQGNPGQ
jgi:hypothetical protein